MRRILFILSLVLIFSGCSDKNSFSVEGLIKGKPDKTIYLKKLDVNTEILIDSSKVSKKGEFKFKRNTSETAFYQLGYSSDNFITLLAEPGEKIILVFDDTTLFEHYHIEGSPGSEKLKFLDQTLNETREKLDSLTTLYNKASDEPDFDVQKPLLEKEFNNLIMAQRKKNIEFIITNTTSLASIKALYQRINPETYVLYSPNDLQYLKIVADSLTRYYPNSNHVQALVRDLDKEMNQMYVSQLEKAAENIPATDLNPDLIDVNGKRVALSSLRGKYVLLTFWSIRSKECVAENLQLKEYYKMYRKKGFEIYQINLDPNESEWKYAVKYDELPWISTREDDPQNPKNAMLFNVKNLPANYLFNKKGEIIGSNLHGKSLQLRLEQLFQN
jgi:thiol-disulfide isomerase/thioredoxin